MPLYEIKTNNGKSSVVYVPPRQESHTEQNAAACGAVVATVAIASVCCTIS